MEQLRTHGFSHRAVSLFSPYSPLIHRHSLVSVWIRGNLFIIWCKALCCFLYSVAQIAVVLTDGNLFIGSCVPLMCPHHCVCVCSVLFLSVSFFSCAIRYSGPFSVYPAPVLKSRSLVPLIRKWHKLSVWRLVWMLLLRCGYF